MINFQHLKPINFDVHIDSGRPEVLECETWILPNEKDRIHDFLLSQPRFKLPSAVHLHHIIDAKALDLRHNQGEDGGTRGGDDDRLFGTPICEAVVVWVVKSKRHHGVHVGQIIGFVAILQL